MVVRDEIDRLINECNQIVINVIGRYARLGYAEAIAYQEENHVPMEWR